MTENSERGAILTQGNLLLKWKCFGGNTQDNPRVFCEAGLLAVIWLIT